MINIESDEQRLAMLEGMPGLGSVTARTDAGEFCGLFDRDYVEVAVGAIDVADSVPALLCLESDAKRLSLTAGVSITIEGEGIFKVLRSADRPPDVGFGFTRLFLSS